MSFEDDEDFDAESVQKWRAHSSKRIKGGWIHHSPSSQTTKRKSEPNPRKNRSSGQKYDSHSADDRVPDDYVPRRRYIVRNDPVASCIGTLLVPGRMAHSSDHVVNDGAVKYEVGGFEPENQLSVSVDSRHLDSVAPLEHQFDTERKLTGYSDTSVPLQCSSMEVEQQNSHTASFDARVSTCESSPTLSSEPHSHAEVVRFNGGDRTMLSKTCSALSAAGESLQCTSTLPCSVVSGTTGSIPASKKGLHATSKRKYEGTYPCSAPQKKQASLLSFLSSGQGGVKRTGLDCPTASKSSPHSRNMSPYDHVPGHEQIPSPHLRAASYPISHRQTRSCPFYKRIPGDEQCILIMPPFITEYLIGSFELNSQAKVIMVTLCCRYQYCCRRVPVWDRSWLLRLLPLPLSL